MTRLQRFYRSRKVREKILINYLAMIIMTIVVLITIVTSVSSRSIEDTADMNTLQLVKQVNNNIEFYIKNMEDLIYYIASDEMIQSYMQGGETEEGKAKILKFLETFEVANPEIAGLALVSSKDQFISNSMMRRSRDPLIIEDWYTIASKEPLDLHILSKPIGRNLEYKDNIYSADDVVSITKAILLNGKMVGVILIDFKLAIFEEVIQNVVVGKNGFVYVEDEFHNIVYSPINKVVYHIQPDSFENPKMKSEVSIKGTKYKLMWVDSDYTKLKVIGVFSLKDALQDVSNMRTIALMISVIMILISLIISYVLSRTLTKPMAKLERLMKKAEDGELDVCFDSHYNDEIGQLGQRFNHMIDAIKNLINLVYLEQQKKREAELEIFQAQIKPHFLYNTLDTIHWLIVEGKNEEADCVLKALTKLFRISLSKGNEFIPLRDEIKHAESYLTIQMVRYAGKFDYEIECDEALLTHNVTKIILQPIIENAIYHGIKEKAGKGFIRVRIFAMGKVLYFVVSDDGLGMKPEEVSRINTVLLRETEKQNEYGLVNVNERIKLTYGNDYGVTLESRYGEGTTVTITHPIL